MDIYDTLRRHAKDHRDKTIKAARKRYMDSLADIDRLQTNNGHRMVRPEFFEREIRHAPPEVPITEIKLVDAAHRVLTESDKPLRVLDILMELKRRGRECDDPRRMATSIRSAFRYHRHIFIKDKLQRWSVVNTPPHSPEVV